MTKRIFTGIILVSLISMLVGTGLIMGVMYDYLGEKIDDELYDEAQMVATALDMEGETYLESLQENADLDSRVTIIEPAGDVLFDTAADSEKMQNHLEREEVK